MTHPGYIPCTSSRVCHRALGHSRSMCATAALPAPILAPAAFLTPNASEDTNATFLLRRCECSEKYFRNNASADTSHDPAADCSALNGAGYLSAVVFFLGAVGQLSALCFSVLLVVKLKHGTKTSCFRIKAMWPLVQSLLCALSQLCLER